MLALGRLASFVLFVLSLSLLSCAVPTPVLHGQNPSRSHVLAVRGYREGAGDAKVLLGAIIDLKAKINTRADAIAYITADALVEAQAEIDSLVADIEFCSNAIASLKNLKIDARIGAAIASHVLVIVRAILKICLSLMTKFGVQVFLDLFAKLDLCLKILLRSLDVCMDGFLADLAKRLVEADMNALAGVKLIVCHDLLVLVRAAVGIVA
ncbi:unnamed protein product [Rhizoctonia solani]|uniref:Transmembrane protein n=1 Tax=Rhizoctonia solani TaxID=456999 RepID=A0A8H3BBH9_9AGAM|nr:unnamed protein product [Rhizoctonia solani]